MPDAFLIHPSFSPCIQEVSCRGLEKSSNAGLSVFGIAELVLAYVLIRAG